MQYTKGERVRHPTVSEWGVGVVMADSSRDYISIYFAAVGQKKLSLRHVEPVRVAEQEANDGGFPIPKPQTTDKSGRLLCVNCGQPTTFGDRANPHRVALGWCEPCFRQSQRTFTDPETREKRYLDETRTMDGIRHRYRNNLGLVPPNTAFRRKISASQPRWISEVDRGAKGASIAISELENSGESFAPTIPDGRNDSTKNKDNSQSRVPKTVSRTEVEKISLESPMAHPAAVAPKAAIPRTIEPKPVTLERVDSKPATPRAATPSLAPQIDKPKPTPAAIHFIVLDFETTGGSPKNGHAIVEIGAVKLDIDGNTLSEFTELVNPGRPIPYQFATEIHGIRDRDVAHCDPVDKVWDRFLAWASGFAALIVHYVPFERQFIDALYRGNAPPFEYICTCQLARKIYRGAENHKLGTVCAHIGYQIQNAHRALPDARAAAHLFVDMVRRDPSIISRFTKAAPQAPRDAAVQPQTERPTTNNERKVPNAAPPIGIVSTRAGVKSQIVSEIPSPPESTLQYIRPRTGERHSKRPAGPIPTPRIQFDSGALTPAEERTLIAADEARSTRLVEEELCRKREAEQHKQFAELAQSPSCKITSHVLADGRALRGYFKENSLTGAGVCNWPDGRVYEGEFVNGEITGQGELTMPNGQIYAGAFVNGKLSGSAGRVRWATGATCDNLDMQFVTPSEPLPRQEPMPEPKQAKPVDNEVRQIQSVNEMFSEIAARQRQAEDRALIAADEPRQTRELEAQEKRYREDTCTEVEACPSQDPKSSDTSLSTPQRRNVGIALGFAIYAVPWIFVWITLLPGYSKTARYAAFGWLSFISAIFLAATILPPSPAQRSPHQGVHNATHRLGSSLPNTINTSSDPKTKVLLAAARSGEKLHIRYTKPYVNGVSERWISPQRVFSKHGETENYMEAHCHKRNEMRAQVNAPQRAWLWGIDSFGARRSA